MDTITDPDDGHTRPHEAVAPSSGPPTGDVPDGAGEPDERATTGGDGTAPGTGSRWSVWLGGVAIAGAALLFWRGFQIEGHNGGDDFALYTDQARSLLHGDVGETLAATRYAVENSAWHSFSPYAYPWGLPLLLVPAMLLTGTVDRVTGVDYAPLKLVVSITFLVGLLAYWQILRRRMHWAGAVLLPLFFGLNYWYVGHTDQVLSELPFLMAVMLFLAWYDRLRVRELLLGPRLGPLVVLGLLACWAFNTRREGIGVLLGLAAGQAALAWGAAGAGPWRDRLDRAKALPGRALAAPWVAFAGGVAVFQIALPSDLLPKYSERQPDATRGLFRIGPNLERYWTILGEQLGLKDPGPVDVTLFGSATLGTTALTLVVVFAGLGIVLGVVRAPAAELPIVGAFAGVALAVLVTPFSDYRYLMSLVPFVVYFAYQGVALPIRMALRVPIARTIVVADLLVVGFIVGGWPDTSNMYEYRTGWVGPQAGPQQPATLEMFEAVRLRTRGDSVIVFNRARMMHLYTARRAVQGGAIEFIEDAGDYYVMYLEPDGSPGTYSQYPLGDAEAADRGFDEVWRNAGWVIWRTPGSRAAPLTTP